MGGKIKQIVRGRRLTDEEAAKYREIRALVAGELPELRARARVRLAAANRDPGVPFGGGGHMNAKYGYEPTAWDAAKEEIRGILVERARARGTIAYSDLVERVTALRLEPNSYALAAMLGEISSAEDAAGRGMLTVIVVHKVGDMQPGPGFFELARRLGRDTSDKLKCWSEGLEEVHRYWGGSGG